jgi:hypothetical protein
MFQSAEHFAETGLAHAYASEDLVEVQAILGRQYHAVVGNPPYIVVKDAALNAAYRKHYASCHMKYSLGAPFTERFFELALPGAMAARRLRRVDHRQLLHETRVRQQADRAGAAAAGLSHVIDTSGAYIPGHGTPTVILFGRHRAPVGDGVRTVMGIKGEPSTPDDYAKGLVWSPIVGQIDRAQSESEFVSVSRHAEGDVCQASHGALVGAERPTSRRPLTQPESRASGGPLAMGFFGISAADEDGWLTLRAYGDGVVETERHVQSSPATKFVIGQLHRSSKPCFPMTQTVLF